MLYDRCPQCRGPMHFHAITSVAKIGWRRWLDCEKCGLFVSSDSHGGNVRVDKSAPPKKALARNEVLADAGSAADRFGQDYVRNLSEVQQVRIRT